MKVKNYAEKQWCAMLGDGVTDPGVLCLRYKFELHGEECVFFSYYRIGSDALMGDAIQAAKIDGLYWSSEDRELIKPRPASFWAQIFG